MMHRTLICSIAAIALAIASAASPAESAHFDLSTNDVLIDDVIPIAVSGVSPGAKVTVRLRGGLDDEWTSSAKFIADDSGRIDLTRMAPVSGSYKDADAMGLFWSAERKATPSRISDENDVEASPDHWTLTAEFGGAVVARASIRRRAVAAGVRMTPVRERGLAGTFYEPPGGGRHPTLLVLSGSGGGIPPATGPAGGLASRGYAVLALAYFGVEGLPRSLSNIPIEYFGSALRWLESQPSVDPTRVGVVGASRGAELALLLGTAFEGLRIVVAYEPSNVVWRGCCDRAAQVAWTIGGRPIAAMPPTGRRVSLEAELAEIQVERIHGAVLLISGRDDGVWPSSAMAERIVERLKRNNFAYAYKSHVYDHAGHGIARPYTSTMELNSRRHPLTGKTVHLGGTPAGTAKAREDSWRQMLAFVDEHLRDAATAPAAR
ncbi:MAG TPA: acyl-CoA thioesterase/bile acid-CoA:amino acid N-acyltransferase family protein [Thermoanaerobaculia bacterium]|nr:acyl-CoA thioesterase/bile acid-CoA:amino acid N-acyltransferase family protein [Thermoanaerobaculia bacterium]